MKRSDLFFTLLLIPIDLVSIILGFIAAYFLRLASFDSSYIPALPEFLITVCYFLPAWILSFAASGLYSPHYITTSRLNTVKIFWATTSGLMLFVVAMFFLNTFFSRLIILYSLICIYIAVLLMRYLLIITHRFLRTFFSFGLKKIILVGSTELVSEIAYDIQRQYRKGYSIIGMVTLDDLDEENTSLSIPRLGSIDRIGAIVAQNEPDELIVADPRIDHSAMINIIHLCEDKGVVFRFVPSLLALYTKNNSYETFGKLPVFTLQRSPLQGWGRIIKRSIDIIGALVGIILSLPIQIIIAILIKLTSPGPLLFKQERVGRDGTFTFYKFRSMYLNAHERHEEFIRTYGNMFKLKNDPRVTPIGRILRKTSLDEIPQFYNVLKGDMSLVGPRPPMPIEAVRYTREQKKRLGEVKPGITGLWQVSGRSDISFDEWVKLDVLYIENWTLALDIYIILKTIWVMIFRKGAY